MRHVDDAIGATRADTLDDPEAADARRAEMVSLSVIGAVATAEVALLLWLCVAWAAG